VGAAAGLIDEKSLTKEDRQLLEEYRREQQAASSSNDQNRAHPSSTALRESAGQPADERKTKMDLIRKLEQEEIKRLNRKIPSSPRATR
jgi:hypothetical protein